MCAHAPAAGMADPADTAPYELHRDAFASAFKAVQHTLLCRTVGDANVYNTYFEKQCAEQNAQALHLQASLEILTRLDDVVNDLVRRYLALSHGKSQIILDILSSIDTFDIKTFHGFAVCAIDGVIIHTGLCMKDSSTDVCFVIGMKFKYFLFTFWLVRHFQSICLRRIVTFVKTRKKNDTLQAVIESFNAKFNHDDDVYGKVFLWAYSVLLKSLQLTVSKLELQRQRQA
jgi:hypothetical protein